MIEVNNKKYRLIPEEHLDEILDAVKEIIKFHNSDSDSCDCEIPQEVWEGAELIQNRVVDGLCFDAIGIVLSLERLGFHQESSAKVFHQESSAKVLLTVLAAELKRAIDNAKCSSFLNMGSTRYKVTYKCDCGCELDGSCGRRSIFSF